MTLEHIDDRTYLFRLDRTLEHRLTGYFRLTGPGGAVRGAKVVVNDDSVAVRETSEGVYVLSTTGYADSPALVELTILAAHHRPQQFATGIDLNNPNLGVFDISPRPIRVAGSVLGEDDQPPSGGVSLSVAAVPGSTGHPAALRTPLVGEYPQGTPIAIRSYTTDGREILRQTSIAGEQSVTVNNVSAWSPGLAFRTGPDSRRAYLRVASTYAPGSSSRVPLTTPVARTTGVGVEFVSAGPVLQTGFLQRPARAGDGVLWLDNDVAAGIVELGDELAEVGLVLDGHQSFALDGVSAPIRIEAHGPAGLGASVIVSDFSEPERRLALVLRIG